ncbi:MAG: hypothetical protein J7M29_10165, partial [Verrucomicrobia bacterium]|nr:hypothetical protein [Verrucomicrobiota bacterium]
MKLLDWPIKRRRSAILGIALEERRAALAWVRRAGNGPEPVKAFAVDLPEDWSSDPEAAGRRLREKLQKEGVKTRTCAVTLSRVWTLSGSVELPRAPEEELNGFVELQAERLFPFPRADMALAWTKISTNGAGSRATIVAFQQRRLRALERMLAAAGCRPISVTVDLERAEPADGEKPGAEIQIEPRPDRVDLTLWERTGLLEARSAPLPGKGGPEALTPQFLTREIRLTLARLPLEIRNRVARVRLVGDPAQWETLAAACRAALARMGVEFLVSPARRGGNGTPKDLPPE